VQRNILGEMSGAVKPPYAIVMFPRTPRFPPAAASRCPP
jgi:hypothetical protein